MFCLQCLTEYRPGFTRCADCGVDLVERLPEEPEAVMDDGLNLVPVLQTRDRTDVPSIRMVLDLEGIDYVLQGELLSSLRDPIVLLVREDQAERVKVLLKGIRLNYSSSIFNPNRII